jgi:hypothetical protein
MSFKCKTKLLRLILEKKEVLIGGFNKSKGITQAARRNAWIDIYRSLVEDGIDVPSAEKLRNVRTA